MGLRVRLKASFNVSSLPRPARVIAVALQRYGMILADNGSPWYISGFSNPRFNDSALHELDQITGADFEVVDTSHAAERLRHNPPDMGDVGTKLRSERERLGIGIDQVEAETHIRAKFLLAIEEERFDVLPGPAYVRAFVRGYAEALGLDPQELVAELNTRPGMEDEAVMIAPAAGLVRADARPAHAHGRLGARGRGRARAAGGGHPARRPPQQLNPQAGTVPGCGGCQNRHTVVTRWPRVRACDASIGPTACWCSPTCSGA